MSRPDVIVTPPIQCECGNNTFFMVHKGTLKRERIYACQVCERRTLGRVGGK